MDKNHIEFLYRIHVWYIYLHLVDFYGFLQVNIPVPWILWVCCLPFCKIGGWRMGDRLCRHENSLETIRHCLNPRGTDRGVCCDHRRNGGQESAIDIDLLGQWLNFKLFGITYLVGKIKFKLFFSGSIG